VAPAHNGPPPPRVWASRFPPAAARLTACRKVVVDLAEEHDLPPENLLEPEAIRRLAWAPPEELSADSVSAALAGAGARQWQIDLTSQALLETLDGLD
jgi:ribonuclease D